MNLSLQTPSRLIALAIASTAVLAACTTQRLPETEDMKVTKKAADVKGCELLGTVTANPPFRTSSDATNQLMNRVALLGGNTLFVLQMSLGPAEGAA